MVMMVGLVRQGAYVVLSIAAGADILREGEIMISLGMSIGGY